MKFTEPLSDQPQVAGGGVFRSREASYAGTFSQRQRRKEVLSISSYSDS